MISELSDGNPELQVLTMHHHKVQTEPTTNTLPPFVPTPRILVVDADDDTRALYSESFQLNGCDVAEAADGRDALTEAFRSPPSLVVTEIRLPFLDGYALCEILRRDRATADVPILVVTADARPAEMDRVQKAGADVVVAKPTTLDIVSLSRRLLGEVKQLRAGAATGASAAAPHEISKNALDRSGEHDPMVLVEVHSRFSAPTPATPPFPLACPRCNRTLTYHRTHIGGVSERYLDQWDYYTCPVCGAIQYRQRTRTLRRVASVP